MAAISTNKGTYQVNAAILPVNATNKTLTWSVDNPEVASVNASGLVTALDNGTVIIKAMANDGSGKSGTLTITITNQVILITSIVLT
jgi:uncharacterized protein YjdB